MKTILERTEKIQNEFKLPHLQLTTGLWVNGRIFWLQDQNEKIITKENLTVKIKQEYMNSHMRNSSIFITNHSGQENEIKLIVMHQYVRATKDHLAFISPSEQVIFHLANKKVFLVNGTYEGQIIQQATIQPFWNMNTEQMWSCKNKGILKYQPMVKGIAVSMFTLNMLIPPHETKKASTWSIIGDTKSELLNLNHSLLKNTLAFPFN